jgi:hypothetical protein
LAQIKNKFIADNAVSGGKIRLGNNESLRARNVGDSADVELMKLDTSDVLQFLTHPQISSSASGDNDVLTLKDLNQELEGLKPKEACRVATTAAITLSGVQTIDGILLVDGDRVLVKDQASAVDNGIYVVAAGAWSRSEDMDATSPVNEVNGAYTFIQEGTDNEGKGFVQQGSVNTIGVDDINFVYFNSAADLVGGDGIDITSNTISVDHDGEGLTFVAGQLALELDGSSLSKSGTGVQVADGGVTEAKLGADVDAESLQIATGYTPAAGAVTVGDTVQAAIEKIEGKVDAVSVPTIAREIITLLAGDITNGYIDLAATPLASSVLFEVAGAPSQVEGVDWSLSTNRITFLGDLASGGSAALEAGDVLQVTYRS